MILASDVGPNVRNTYEEVREGDATNASSSSHIGVDISLRCKTNEATTALETVNAAQVSVCAKDKIVNRAIIFDLTTWN